MKKSKSYIVVLLFCFAALDANAQIGNEIKAYVDSSEMIINNGRRLLLQSVQTKDYRKMAEIYNYLKVESSLNNCIPFSYNEDLHITSLTGSWDEFLIKAENFSVDAKETLCYPIHDQVGTFLYKEVYGNAGKLLENALSNQSDSEKRDLLELYFYIVENGQNETFDTKVKNFKKNYPKSRYSDFLNYYLPQPEQKLAMTFGMGASGIFPTGKLGQHFDPNGLFALSMDFYVNNFFGGLQLDGGGRLKLNAPLLRSVTGYPQNFLKGDYFSYMNVGLLGGYIVARNNILQFSPFVYLGGTSLTSNLYKNSEDDDLEFRIFDSFFIGPGLRTEFKIWEFDMKDRYMNMSMPGCIALRLDVGYSIPVHYEYTAAKGNILYTRLALTWWIGNF